MQKHQADHRSRKTKQQEEDEKNYEYLNGCKECSPSGDQNWYAQDFHFRSYTSNLTLSVSHTGTPLANKGACKHFKKSYRYFRFPCCGRAFACPVCHELSGCEFANGTYSVRSVRSRSSRIHPSHVSLHCQELQFVLLTDVVEHRYVQLMKSVESVAQSRRSRGTLKFALRVNSIWVNAVVERLIFGVEARETTRYFQRRIVGRRKEEVPHWKLRRRSRYVLVWKVRRSVRKSMRTVHLDQKNDRKQKEDDVLIFFKCITVLMKKIYKVNTLLHQVSLATPDVVLNKLQQITSMHQR